MSDKFKHPLSEPISALLGAPPRFAAMSAVNQIVDMAVDVRERDPQETLATLVKLAGKKDELLGVPRLAVLAMIALAALDVDNRTVDDLYGWLTAPPTDPDVTVSSARTDATFRRMQRDHAGEVYRARAARARGEDYPDPEKPEVLRAHEAAISQKVRPASRGGRPRTDPYAHKVSGVQPLPPVSTPHARQLAAQLEETEFSRLAEVNARPANLDDGGWSEADLILWLRIYRHTLGVRCGLIAPMPKARLRLECGYSAAARRHREAGEDLCRACTIMSRARAAGNKDADVLLIRGAVRPDRMGPALRMTALAFLRRIEAALERDESSPAVAAPIAA